MYMTYLFFFFKQKTAYEMRISDWSSDVCSSDLSNSIVSASEWPTNTGTRTHVACTLILGSRIFLVSATIFHSSLVEPSSRNESMCGMTLKAICLVNFLASAWSPTKMLRQIGRASCRERVCQYV